MNELVAAPAAIDGAMAEVRKLARSMKIRSLDGATRSAILYSDDLREYADRLLAMTATPHSAEQEPAPDVAGLVEALEQCRFALEPYDDIKPRNWVTDREGLRRAHELARAALAAYHNKGKP